jgi:hypothetical protein
MINEIITHDLGACAAKGSSLISVKADFDITYKSLFKHMPKDPPNLVVAGKSVPAPRLILALGHMYAFNESDFETIQISDVPEVIRVMAWGNKRFEPILRGKKFNTAFLNCYRNGLDYIGYHSDKREKIDKDSPILTFSVLEEPEGVLRKFTVKNISNGETYSVPCEHNVATLMCGKFQETHKHCIPKITSKKLDIKGRISISLRCISSA